jgi:phosphoglycolate phosphatase
VHAVLLDLDGTLFDSAPDIVAAANRMLDELGAPPLPFAVVRGFIGHGVPNLVRRVLAGSAIAGSVDEQHGVTLFYRCYGDTNGRFGRVFPGVEEGLAELRRLGYQLGCVTNKPLAFALPLLELCGLAACLDVVVAGDSIARMKPDPAPLLHACARLNVDPAHCVLVGDSEVDVAAARAANMPVFIVRYGYARPDGYSRMRCEAFIDSLHELAPLLKARFTTRR